MIVKKGIVIRVKPSAEQREKLEQHFGCNRFLWNYFLNKRREDYQRDKTSSNYYKDAAALTTLKQQPENLWMYETSTASQQRTLKNLDDAYRRFFKGHARFPRFKSKRHDQSFTLAWIPIRPPVANIVGR
jgi:putative transposase